MVASEDKRDALFFELEDQIEDLGGHQGVQSRGGFVEEEERGFSRDGANDRDALTLSTGEFVGFFMIGRGSRTVGGVFSLLLPPGAWDSHGLGRGAR